MNKEKRSMRLQRKVKRAASYPLAYVGGNDYSLMAPLKQTLVYSLVAFLMAARAYAFPTEEQVRSHLHSGMTAKEVVALFGKPVSGVAETCVNCTFRYVAPFGMLNVEREGYIGFVIDFRDGKASEWRIINGYPSFAPSMMPWSVKIWVWLLP